MIDWEATIAELDRYDLSGVRPKVIVKCDQCGNTSVKAIRNKSKVKDNQLAWQCARCVANRPDKKRRSSEGAKQAWQDDEYAKRISENSKRIWKDEELRDRMSAFRKQRDFAERMAEINKNKPIDTQKLSKAVKARWENEDYRRRMVENLKQISRASWADENYRKKISESTKRSWENEVYRKHIESSLLKARQNQQRVSSIQEILYSILDDLGVKYYREYNDKTDDNECTVGPYSFDCVIPRNNAPDLLIECQGEYWHSENTRHRDFAKASYINNNFPGIYEIKYLWEHEFYNKNKIAHLVKYWLGISSHEIIKFDFSDIEIRKCTKDDYHLLLSKYHYLGNAGRGGIVYGAYHGDDLAAVIVFSPLLRQNIETYGYPGDKCRELSRLCIHPKYQKKNFGSWFIARAIKHLDQKYQLIIAYCDTTFNHDGAIYKAANFELAGEVRPDYWYANDDGWVMHKRTLYGRAIAMKMKESEYAAKHGYHKIYGKKKLKFIYWG